MDTQTSPHAHADGKLGEVSKSTKHFWSFTAKQCSSVLLNNWSRWGLVLKLTEYLKCLCTALPWHHIIDLKRCFVKRFLMKMKLETLSHPIWSHELGRAAGGGNNIFPNQFGTLESDFIFYILQQDSIYFCLLWSNLWDWAWTFISGRTSPLN